jgi:hypothetical protein
MLALLLGQPRQRVVMLHLFVQFLPRTDQWK